MEREDQRRDYVYQCEDTSGTVEELKNRLEEIQREHQKKYDSGRRTLLFYQEKVKESTRELNEMEDAHIHWVQSIQQQMDQLLKIREDQRLSRNQRAEASKNASLLRMQAGMRANNARNAAR